MSSKSPVFPIPAESHHFSDYGFDPQIDYFQVLEEAKRHKRDNNDDNNLSIARSIDSLHFKLQKPTSNSDSKDDDSKKKKSKWWRNVMVFLRRRLVQGSPRGPRPYDEEEIEEIRCRGPYVAGSKSGPLYLTESRGSSTPYRGSSSGPLYLTESLGSSTPYRSRGTSGPVSRMLTPTRRRISTEVEIPYVSLRELNMEIHHSDSAMPIYLVT